MKERTQNLRLTLLEKAQHKLNVELFADLCDRELIVTKTIFDTRFTNSKV